jgi:hypothetical protein
LRSVLQLLEQERRHLVNRLIIQAEHTLTNWQSVTDNCFSKIRGPSRYAWPEVQDISPTNQCARALPASQAKFDKATYEGNLGFPKWDGRNAGVSGSLPRFGLFEAEEMDVAADVAGNDKFEHIGECTANGRAVAGERG